jgi:ATP-dependent DNA helicase DinG
MTQHLKDNLLTLNFWSRFKSRVVFLDFETTGINFETDKIIEIGAFAVKNNQAGEQYSTLINPGTPVPQLITALTGISTEMTAHAPSLESQKEKFCNFIDGAIVVAHNANFEKTFIARDFTDARPACFIDSCEVAMLMMPQLKYFNLEKILNNFNIKESEDHRALIDAKDTFYALNHIISYSLARHDEEYYKMISAGAEACLSPSTAEFFKILHSEYRALAKGAASKKAPGVADTGRGARETGGQSFFKFAPEPGLNDSLNMLFAALDEKNRLTNDDYIVQSGLVSTALKTFGESRCAMVEIAHKMNRIDCLLHAGAIHAKRTGESVFIIESQQAAIDSIAKNHIPVALAAFNNEIRFRALKEPECYLCKLNFDLLEENALDAEEKFFLLYIKCYLAASPDGHMENVAPFLTNKYPRLKQHLEFIKSSADYCLRDKCPKGRNCFFKSAQYHFLNSDVIVTSLATYLKWKDIFAGLKNEKALNIVMDQAHKIEDAIVEAFGGRFNRRELFDVLDEFKEFYSRLAASEGAGECLIGAHRTAEHSLVAARDFFDCLKAIVDQMSGCRDGAKPSSSSTIPLNKLIEDCQMHEIFFEKLINLSIDLKNARRALEKIIRNMLGSGPGAYGGLKKSEAVFKTHKFLKCIQKYDNFIVQIIQSSDLTFVSYLKLDGFKQEWFIHVEPVDIGKILAKNIFGDAKSFLLVSSSLSINNSYEFIKWNLGLQKYRKLEITSYSQYCNNVALDLLIPREMPVFDSKNTAPFIARLSEMIVKIAVKKPQKMMVLFNSVERMTSVYKIVNENLAAAGIKCFYQRGEMLSENVIRHLKSDGACVILGSQGLMDFTDLCDESIDTLVIEKLPFPFFEDPRIAVRKKKAAADGLSEFEEYMLPKTLLKIKQTIGRIGEKNGKGLLVIADSKLINARYLGDVLNALPLYNTYYTFEEYWRDNN